MKLPGILTPQLWPSMTPVKLVLDLPETLVVAYKETARAYRDEPADPMVRINFLKPRSTFIANNIYLSTYWRIRERFYGLSRKSVEASLRRALDPANLKRSARSILTLERLRESLHRETDFAVRGLVKSALRFSGDNRLIRINLLAQPSDLYPRMEYLYTRLRFAADITWETMIA